MRLEAAAAAAWRLRPLARCGSPASASRRWRATTARAVVGRHQSVFGFGGGDDQPDIDYRDHAKLVVPPKLDLPQPAPPAFASVSDWPRDPDVERWKRAGEKKQNKTFIPERDATRRSIRRRS